MLMSEELFQDLLTLCRKYKDKESAKEMTNHLLEFCFMLINGHTPSLAEGVEHIHSQVEKWTAIIENFKQKTGEE